MRGFECSKFLKIIDPPVPTLRACGGESGLIASDKSVINWASQDRTGVGEVQKVVLGLGGF